MTRKTHPETLEKLLSPKEWWIEEEQFNINKINAYESLFTVGNGYSGTRGGLEGGHTAAFPQTFINGIFDHHDSTITHIVNLPDWTQLYIMANNEHLSIQNCKVLKFHRILDMKQGMLYCLIRFQDLKGNITRYESIRYANYSNRHLHEIKVAITPENYSGELVIQSKINGHVFNLDRIPAYDDPKSFHPEIKWEKWAKSKHLAHVISKPLDKNNLYLEMKTLDRPHHIGYASTLNILNSKTQILKTCDYEQTYHVANIQAKKGKTIHFEKLVSIFTTREIEKNKLPDACQVALNQGLDMSFNDRFSEHKKVWDNKWHDSDCVIVGDNQANKALRFAIYHLLIAANEFDPKTNIGAKSMSGEGYEGHTFWDTDIFTLPFYIYTQPTTAKSLVMYRYNTLKGAKGNAEASGYKGARYPWESADSGHEETPSWSADGKNRIWPGEEEIHITADVVRGMYTYFVATLDEDFMINHGSIVVFEASRFWASRLEYNKRKDRYELSSIIGPDEFHEHINNNVFTNWMAKWNLQKGVETFHWLKTQHPTIFQKLNQSLNITDEEIDIWQEIAKKVYILYDPDTKLLEEFEDYYKLRDVPITKWTEKGMPLYPEGLNDFNSGGTMLVKQADVIALLYILSDEFDEETKRINYDYYEPRTMHSSSLSMSMHAIMAISTRNVSKALRYFKNTAYVDLHDLKKSTATGVHIAAAGGTWQSIVCGYGGMRVRNRRLTFGPWLPQNWKEIKFKLKWHGDDLQVNIRHDEAEFYWDTKAIDTMTIEVTNKLLVLRPKEKTVFRFKPEKKEIKV